MLQPESMKAETTSLPGSRRNPFDVITNIFRKRSRDEVGCSAQDGLRGSDYDIRSHSAGGRRNGSLSPSFGVPRREPMPIPSSTLNRQHRAMSAGGPTMTQSSDRIWDMLSTSPVSPRVRNLEEDMEALRQSRQDNPYIQQQLERFSLQDDCLLAPSVVTQLSATQNDEQQLLFGEDNDNVSEKGIGIYQDIQQDLHEHLIRSPPPQFPHDITQFVFSSRNSSPQHQLLQDRSNETQDSYSVRSLNFGSKDSNCLLKPKGSLTLTSTSDLPSVKEHRHKDLKPVQWKSGALDPGMREVLAFQRQQLLNEQRKDSHSPSEGVWPSADPVPPAAQRTPQPKTPAGWPVSGRPVTFPSVLPTGSLPGLTSSGWTSDSPTLAPLKGWKSSAGNLSSPVPVTDPTPPPTSSGPTPPVNNNKARHRQGIFPPCGPRRDSQESLLISKSSLDSG